jgi:hypothetical protein
MHNYFDVRKTGEYDFTFNFDVHTFFFPGDFGFSHWGFLTFGFWIGLKDSNVSIEVNIFF